MHCNQNRKEMNNSKTFDRQRKFFNKYISSIKKALKKHIRRYDYPDNINKFEALIEFKGNFFFLTVSYTKNGIEIKLKCPELNLRTTFLTFDFEIGSKLFSLFDTLYLFERYPYDD